MVASTSGHAPSAGGQATRWAVGLALGGAAAVAAAAAVTGLAYALSGSGATEDNWVGLLTVALAVVVGLVASMTTFALAVMVSMRSYPRTRLWLPLTVFPALVALLVLGELVWWE